MKIAVLTGSVTRASGGLFNSVRELSRCLNALPETGIDVHSYAEHSDPADLQAWDPIIPICHRVAGPWAFRFAPGIRKAIISGGYDLVHTHGLWLDASRAAMEWRRHTGGNYLVSPRGMLDPWALANSRWKKRIAAALFENRHLRGAACIHALCKSEAESIRAYGLKNPVAIIPNGVSLPKANVKCEMRNAESGERKEDAEVFSFQFSVFRDKETRHPLPATRNAPLRLLFLGRLHPKKGLPQALRAWAETRHSPPATRDSPPWQFVIAGWDQGGHESELKRLCRELSLRYVEGRGARGESFEEKGRATNAPISNILSPSPGSESLPGDVIFTGPAFGEEKDALLRSSDALILPSLSEGLPMSVLEAWAYGLPVLMTPECNLPEGFEAGAALRITIEGAGNAGVFSFQSSVVQGGGTTRSAALDTRHSTLDAPSSISLGLQTLFEMSDSDRLAMGARGRRLVEDRFTWPKVAAQMKNVYEWVLGGGPKPEAVV